MVRLRGEGPGPGARGPGSDGPVRSGLVWERDGADWPNREASRFVEAAGLRWHVQQQGQGPVVLLLHGTGSATHTWRGLLPLLADRFTLIAPDLPGHGFTRGRDGSALSLPGMARRLGALLAELGARPQLVVGHSAGAAVACRLALDGLIDPDVIVGLNPALLPLAGFSGALFPALARVLTANPLVPWLLARRGSDRRVVEGLLRGTGSRLDAEGVHLYARLLRDRRHVSAALGMMARWDLRGLADELRRLRARLVLVVGTRDRYVPPSDAQKLRERVPHAEIVSLEGVGHLVHEERPREVAASIERLARDVCAE